MNQMASGSPSKPLTVPAPALAALPKHPGERLADYFDNFFKTIIGISTLGASITFAKFVQAPVTPWDDYGISKNTVQYYLANSWLFFILDLVITTLAASALAYWRPRAIVYFGTTDSHQRRIVMWWATLVSTVLTGLIIVSFIFLGLVVAALAGPVGWVAVAFTVFFGAVILAVIVWQSPIGSPPVGGRRRHEPHPRRRRRVPRYNSYNSQEGLDDDFVGGVYISEEKIDVFTDGPVLTGDEYILEEDVTMRKRSYVNGRAYADGGAYADEPLSRQSTIARPTTAAVPPYTEDLRRMRAIRASDDYDGRYGQ